MQCKLEKEIIEVCIDIVSLSLFEVDFFHTMKKDSVSVSLYIGWLSTCLKARLHI